MINPGLLTILLLVAGVLFILSLGGLSRQETARRGNRLGLIGMIIALVAVVLSDLVTGYAVLAAALIPGVIIGAVLAARVQMTSMPQLVAILHSFVGLAAVLVGFATHLDPASNLAVAGVESVEATIHAIEVYIGVAVGSITFTGSVIAFGKLQGVISGAPLLLPGRHVLNLIVVAGVVGLGVPFVGASGMHAALLPLGIMTALTALLGIHLVMAIGGADMPVVVSMLNSYSGWAAAAAGFMLGNDLLIITGALVGSSGAILSLIMCRGMNRSLVSVILGGFGTGDGGGEGKAIEGDVTATNVPEVCAMLEDAKKIVIVPGYGMAVAKAQHSISQMTRYLRDKGTEVSFAIHPVAGRLPGHMNVLLAEANVPYDIVHELEDINGTFPSVDVVLVIGANDIVNPSALDDPTSPIAGMPVLEVWNAKTVVVMKRSLASGYAGIGNPLFVRENVRMLFGDARENCDALMSGLRS